MNKMCDAPTVVKTEAQIQRPKEALSVMAISGAAGHTGVLLLIGGRSSSMTRACRRGWVYFHAL